MLVILRLPSACGNLSNIKCSLFAQGWSVDFQAVEEDSGGYWANRYAGYLSGGAACRMKFLVTDGSQWAAVGSASMVQR